MSLLITWPRFSFSGCFVCVYHSMDNMPASGATLKFSGANSGSEAAQERSTSNGCMTFGRSHIQCWKFVVILLSGILSFCSEARLHQIIENEEDKRSMRNTMQAQMAVWKWHSNHSNIRMPWCRSAFLWARNINFLVVMQILLNLNTVRCFGVTTKITIIL